VLLSKPYFLIHWLTAALVFFNFGTGQYIPDLDFYSPWYHTLPRWHILSGLTMVLLTCVRLWRRPHQTFKHTAQSSLRWLAQLTHRCLYGLLGVLFTTGYLMATANGDGIIIYQDWTLPALTTLSAEASTEIGTLHGTVSLVLMACVSLHVLGALKHYFFDKKELTHVHT
jgi:cytochrome b561